MTYNPNDNNTIDDDFHIVISNNIKQNRIKKGYSLEDVVSKMKVNQVTRQALYKYEQNKNHMKRETLKEICSIVELDPNDLVKQIYYYLLLVLTHNTKWENDFYFYKYHIDEFIIRHVIETTDLLSSDDKDNLLKDLSRYFKNNDIKININNNQKE